MTEEEAKTKWCPMAGARRYMRRDLGSSNALYKSAACLGSDCMAWRWTESIKRHADGSPGQGHCGLAGKP